MNESGKKENCVVGDIYTKNQATSFRLNPDYFDQGATNFSTAYRAF